MLINISPHAKLISAGKIYSYKSVLEHINKISSILNIQVNQRVGIFCENRPEWIFSFFSVWQRGGINVPMDFMSSENELIYILKDASLKALFFSDKTKPVLEKALKDIKKEIQLINLDEINFSTLKEYKEKAYKDKKDSAVILYTSGTTGNPKGVILSFENLLSNIEGIKKAKIATNTDKTVAILPFHHSYPLMVTMLVPLNIGATIVFLPEFSSETIIKTIQKNRITVLVGVPRLYEVFHRKIFEEINKNMIIAFMFKILKRIGAPEISKSVFRKVHKVFGENIKYFVSGGAKLDVEIAKDFFALGFKIIEGYGLTETSPIVSFNPPEKIKIGSVGKPIEGVQVRIKDGEVLVKGKNVMKGYLNRPEETKKVIRDGWLYTGDLGYLDKEGYLYITGRKKEIIVLPNGKNINPEEIESKILKISPLIKEVAIIEKSGNLFAIVHPDFHEIKKRGIVNIEEYIKWDVIDIYNRKVPQYKRIYGFTITKKELPKTRLGKIKRFRLEEFLKEEKVKKTKEPDIPEYRAIKKYLKEITQREIYPDDHIEIDLGLDSLEKLELITFLEKSFGIQIKESELSRLETVKDLAFYVNKVKKQHKTKEISWSDILKEEKIFPVSEKKLPLIILKKFIKPLFKIYNRLEVKGIENLPDNKNFIIAPNHQSYLDGLLIIASLPDNVLKDTYFVAEEKFFRHKLQKPIVENFHIITVNINKDLKTSLQKIAFFLKRGKNIVIFPEGARTRDGKLMEFKKGFAILSKELDIPVIPVVIKGTFESLPIDSTIPKPTKITLEFLKPVYPDGKSYDEIAETVYKAIKNKLE